MVTHLETYPTLRQQLRLCDAVVVTAGWQVEQSWPDEQSQARTLTVARTALLRVLKGDPAADVAVLVVGGAADDADADAAGRTALPSHLTGDDPVVALLQHDPTTGRYVPLFGSLFPLEGQTVRLTPGLVDDRPDPGEPLTLDALDELIASEAAADADAEELWRRQEPDLAGSADMPALTEMPGEGDLLLPIPAPPHETGPATAEPSDER